MADPQQIAAALNFYDSKKSLDPFAQQNSGERVIPTLANIYSAIDSAKRKGSDFVRNPVESLQQMVGYGMDKANAARDQLYQATEEEGINYGPKTKALAKLMAESYNPVGMFIGPNAASFNKITALKAQELEKLNKTAEEIWQQTGTFRGPDKQWRQEISDKGSKITEDVYNQISANKQFKGPMGQALQHEELYKAYPQTAGIPATMYADEIPSGGLMPGRSGTFQTPLLTVGGPSSMTQRSTALHELQHAIQQREGFASGGSPSNMITELENIAKQKRQEAQNQFRLSTANDPLDPLKIVKPGARKKGLELEKQARELEEKALLASHSGQSRFDLYRKLAGEAEARATQKRRNLTDEERRAIFPLQSYDVPINELIFK
jgi:DNA-binding transcriptional MerR regulator